MNKIVKAGVISVCMACASAVSAKSISKENRADMKIPKGLSNRWGLVYDGAIESNIPGKVNLFPVTYVVNGVEIAANLYVPADYSEKDEKKYPAVAVAHPNGGVKEQVSGLFAQNLAEAGYIALAFDASFQGASGGLPRGLDIPENRVNDVHGAVDYLSTLKKVDSTRIGLLGICGGGGYTLKAAQTEKRAKAVATLSMFNTGAVRLNNGLKGYEPSADIQKRLLDAMNARTEEALTGKTVYPAPSNTPSPTREQLLAQPKGLYSEGGLYYYFDYKHPKAGAAVPLKCLPDLIDFDVRRNMNLVNVPLLMMAGSAADTLYMTEDAFNLATGTENKELYLIDGATHIQTYFVPEYVEKETLKLVEFFGKNL